jgi:hypothetical protein
MTDGVHVTFCDSIAAAEAVGAVNIAAMSPSLTLLGRQGVRALDAAITHERADRIFAASNAAASFAFDLLERRGLAAEARMAALRLQAENRLVFDAAMLDASDYSEPRTVVLLDTGDTRLDRQINSSWAELLETNPRLAVRTVKVDPTRERDHFGGETVPVLERALVASAYRLALPLALKLGSKTHNRIPRRTIGVLSHTEITDDVIVDLARRGFVPLRLEAGAPLSVDHSELDEAATAPLLTDIMAYWRNSFSGLLLNQALDAAARIKSLQLKSDWRAYRLAYAHWTRPENRPAAAAVIASFIASPSQRAFADAMTQHGIPVFSAQHGIGREIEAAEANRSSVLESTAARNVLVFNETAATVTTRNAFALRGARGIACGLTSTHAATMRLARLRASDQAIYVSTFLYRGYVQNRPSFCSDSERARVELKLVEEILGRLPYPVDFKPYPAIRYVDPDPVLAAVSRQTSMRLVGARNDLRYIIGRYRLVISGGATSTIGWCVASDLPFVFLEHSVIGRLSDEAREHFRKGSFYIDLDRSGGFKALLRLLDRPIKDIEREWRSIAAGRARLRRFLGADRTNAGPVGARAVLDAIAAARTMPAATVLPSGHTRNS